MTKSLAVISKAKRALAAARSLDEVLNVRDQAEAVRVYIKAAGDGLEMQNSATEIKLIAERRAGEMLAAMEKKTNQKGAGNTALPALSDLGITKMQSHRWQALATIPAEVFERHVIATKESLQELTTASVRKLLATPEKVELEPFCLSKQSDRVIEQLEGTQADWPEEHWTDLAATLVRFAERLKECLE